MSDKDLYIETLETIFDETDQQERVLEEELEDAYALIRNHHDQIHLLATENRRLENELKTMRVKHVFEVESLEIALESAYTILEIYDERALAATEATGVAFLDTLEEEDRELMKEYYEWLSSHTECCNMGPICGMEPECAPEENTRDHAAENRQAIQAYTAATTTAAASGDTLNVTLDCSQTSCYSAGPKPAKCCVRDHNEDGNCDRHKETSAAAENVALAIESIEKSDSWAEVCAKFTKMMRGQLGRDTSLILLPRSPANSATQ